MTTLINLDVATFINVFTIEPTRQDTLVQRIKSDAEHTISQQPGFIKAIIFRSLDGSRVINVVQWESVEASRAIHRNPAIAAGFASYQELDVQMDLRYYEIAFTDGQPFTMQKHDDFTAQVNVLHVAPENQQRLLEQLTQNATLIASQSRDQSIVGLRSLDGIRVILFLDSHNDENYRNTPIANHIPGVENWIEKMDVNHYQIECVVEKQSLLR